MNIVIKVNSYLHDVARLFDTEPRDTAMALTQLFEKELSGAKPGDKVGDILSDMRGEEIVARLKQVTGQTVIPYELLAAFRKCSVMGDGDCPMCGSDMDKVGTVSEVIGDEQKPVSETYLCPFCGWRRVHYL